VNESNQAKQPLSVRPERGAAWHGSVQVVSSIKAKHVPTTSFD
jgi:hypothetical protein